MKTTRCLLLMLALGLAACDDDDAAATPRTTSELARQEIEQNTSESAAPILLNDLAISDADTSETAQPAPI